MDHSITALVLDGNYKSAMATVRSLGRKGVRVICGAERRTAMGLFSKYAAHQFVYPSPIDERENFLKTLTDIIENEKNEILIYTFSDATTLSVGRGKDSLPKNARLILPESDSFEGSFDKGKTVQLANEIGLETPKTFFPVSKEEIEKISSSLVYPLVLKPRHNVVWRGDRGIKSNVSVIFSSAELIGKWMLIFESTNEAPIVQEYVKGEEFGATFLCKDGNILAGCLHKRIRSFSPAGGASVVKETVEDNYLDIAGMAKNILEKLKWSGPVMVEFKIDLRDGKPKLIEINGRFWGALPLAIHAGVDFPHLHYLMAKGENFEKPNY